LLCRGPAVEPGPAFTFDVVDLVADAELAGIGEEALQNMLGHESEGLTLDRSGHLYGSDVEAVGVANYAVLTRNCGQNVVTDGGSVPAWQAG
jgi:hypothetical protein